MKALVVLLALATATLSAAEIRESDLGDGSLVDSDGGYYYPRADGSYMDAYGNAFAPLGDGPVYVDALGNMLELPEDELVAPVRTGTRRALPETAARRTARAPSTDGSPGDRFPEDAGTPGPDEQPRPIERLGETAADARPSPWSYMEVGSGYLELDGPQDTREETADIAAESAWENSDLDPQDPSDPFVARAGVAADSETWTRIDPGTFDHDAPPTVEEALRARRLDDRGPSADAESGLTRPQYRDRPLRH